MPKDSSYLRPRGDAVPVKVQHNGKVFATIWRRPYTMFMAGGKCDFVRFNYRWCYLDGETINVDDESYSDMSQHPYRYNTISVGG